MPHRSATVLPFRLDHRPPAPARFRRRKRIGGGGSGGPLLVMLPLAAFALGFLWDGPPPGLLAAFDRTPALSGTDTAAAGSGDTESARFKICTGRGRVTCVVDGDTLWYRGDKIRIADINTPEVSQPDCAREAELGAVATQRMRALLNAGPFSLEPVERDRDRYGRLLRTVTRDGASLGAVLVDEGLAEEWQGRRRGWC
ncbi:thermonuclease family protein [Roseibium sp.]|uniref:thermonuclease family protein n=1 Tax=Roseibium sp. TaxID=1936156 RepID=UPI0032977518